MYQTKNYIQKYNMLNNCMTYIDNSMKNDTSIYSILNDNSKFTDEQNIEQ